MARTDYFDWPTSGATIYGKPRPLVDGGAWDGDDVAYSENGTLGEYSASLDESTEYVLFLQDGGSPANTDLVIGKVGVQELAATAGEPAQGTPGVTISRGNKIDYLYKAWRNKKTQTATTTSIFDDAGSTVDQKSTVSDDGSTATIGEIETGP